MKSSVLVLAATMALAGCGKSSDPAPPSQFGASPQLPAPQHGMIPTVHFARPVGWPAGRTPIAAPGLKVEAYARGLLHPQGKRLQQALQLTARQIPTRRRRPLALQILDGELIDVRPVLWQMAVSHKLHRN